MYEVEGVRRPGVIHHRDGQIARQRVGDETVQRLVQVRELVLPGARDEQRHIGGQSPAGLFRRGVDEPPFRGRLGDRGEAGGVEREGIAQRGTGEIAALGDEGRQGERPLPNWRTDRPTPIDAERLRVFPDVASEVRRSASGLRSV